MLALNPYLLRLKIKLSTLCKDASSLFTGGVIFDESHTLHKDDMYECLFAETNDVEFDILTQQALEVIFHAFLIILERQCAYQLPGGKYWHPSEDVQAMSSVVPTSNIASESDFAVLDLIRTKPKTSVQTIQAVTMWSRNKTVAWLNEKPREEQSELLEIARTKVEMMRKKYNERKLVLKDLKQQKHLAKQNAKREAEEKRAARKAEAVNSLVAAKTKTWLSIQEAEVSVLSSCQPCKTIYLNGINFREFREFWSNSQN